MLHLASVAASPSSSRACTATLSPFRLHPTDHERGTNQLAATHPHALAHTHTRVHIYIIVHVCINSSGWSSKRKIMRRKRSGRRRKRRRGGEGSVSRRSYLTGWPRDPGPLYVNFSLHHALLSRRCGKELPRRAVLSYGQRRLILTR